MSLSPAPLAAPQPHETHKSVRPPDAETADRISGAVLQIIRKSEGPKSDPRLTI